MTIIQMPIIRGPETSLEVFLSECRELSIENIRVILSKGRPDLNYLRQLKSLVYVPFSLGFEGRGEVLKAVLKERVFTHVPYSAGDSRLRLPFGGLADDEPLRLVQEYGAGWADYCAEKGFNAYLFMHLFPEEKKQVYSVSEKEAKSREVCRPPRRLIL